MKRIGILESSLLLCAVSCDKAWQAGITSLSSSQQPKTSHTVVHVVCLPPYIKEKKRKQCIHTDRYVCIKQIIRIGWWHMRWKKTVFHCYCVSVTIVMLILQWEPQPDCRCATKNIYPLKNFAMRFLVRFPNPPAEWSQPGNLLVKGAVTFLSASWSK